MKRIIKISNLEKRSVIVEDGADSKQSVFEDVYQKVGLLLKNIIEKTHTETQKNEGKKKVAQICDMDNCISFVGQRGTGKSSAMLTVHHALKEQNDRNIFFAEQEIEDTAFLVLDYIDASTLERGEDILQIVLANMFYELRKRLVNNTKKQWDYDERELNKLFDSIYGNLTGIKNVEKRVREITPLNGLYQLSNSQTLRNDIYELVTKFLKYMLASDGRDKRNQLLVITIDDLDMHFQGDNSNAYEILETLHRYFTIPGVVILLAYNYEDLGQACRKHFQEAYSKNRSELVEYEKENIRLLAEQYLKKILPIYNRVHMPTMMNRDYGRENVIQISLVDDSDKSVREILGEYINQLSPTKETKDVLLVPTKKFLMQMKAAIAGLYYDGNGEKRHFVEVTNLRELSQNYIFYKQLHEIQATEENADRKIYKIILDDLYFGRGKNLPSAEERKRFEKYSEVKIERRSRDILSDLRKISKEKQVTLKMLGYHGNADVSYSYGELLYGLYHASTYGWFSKEMVSCILDSYTIMLTKFYRNMENGDEKYRKRILDVIGSSIASSWSCKFLPEIMIASNVSMPIEMDYRVVPSDSRIRKAAAMKFETCAVDWKFPVDDSRDFNKLREQHQMLEILCMFYTEVYHRDKKNIRKLGFEIAYNPRGNMAFEIGANETRMKIQGQQIAVRFSDACFNVLNFVNNLIDSEHYFETLHESMLNAYMDWFNDADLKNGRRETYTRENVREFMKKNSVMSNHGKWKDLTMGFALPVYSFDMMYNLLKRQYVVHGKTQEYTHVDNFWPCVETLYETLGELLKREDEFYFSDINNCMEEGTYKFYDAYKKCPFIEWFENIKEPQKKKFVDAFKGMVSTISQV